MRFVAEPSTVLDKCGLKKIYKTSTLELLIITSENPVFDFSKLARIHLLGNEIIRDHEKRIEIARVSCIAVAFAPSKTAYCWQS